MEHPTTLTVKRQIWVTADFAAFHRWLGAPEPVSFLKSWHRHKFMVKVTLNVSHADRDLEFFIVKGKLEKVLLQAFKDQYLNMSCEMIAEEIFRHLALEQVNSIEVSEDGENGAIVSFSRDAV